MQINELEKLKPLCPVFGECGGCLYQDRTYAEELKLKEGQLREEIIKELKLEIDCLSPIEASPQEYHYRHRLDLGLRQNKQGEVVIGFVNPQTRQLLDIQECPIARKEVSDFIPQLKSEAKAKLPRDYRQANLTVKTGDDGRVLWGGIGRRSHQLAEKDYLWTVVEGRKIYFSLDNFFQANHFILTRLMEVLIKEIEWNPQTVFFDLYGGVGLFSMVLAPLVKKVVLIEESSTSIEMARYNSKQNGYENIEIYEASVENCLKELLCSYVEAACVAMVDPPRKGLQPIVREVLTQSKSLKHLIYLSCSQESLIRDLKDFINEGWKISKIIPFDFFPRTKHLETLVFLKPGVQSL